MRNVNEGTPVRVSKSGTGFILTMRNVNLQIYCFFLLSMVCFILTMRNVNLYKGDENKVFDVEFYINYEECK